MIESTFLTPMLKSVCAKAYPNFAPADAAAPFLVYTRVSTPRETTLNGPAGVAYPTFRIDVYHDRYAGALTIADDLRKALDGYRGGDVQYCRLVNQSDLSQLDKEDPLSRINLEFKITHNES